MPLKLRPLAFDAPSERMFVRDHGGVLQPSAGKGSSGRRGLYLLRNADREEKGLGFALAGNFYPDFPLLVDDATGKRWLTFVDPKGPAQSRPIAPQAEAVSKSRHWKPP